MTRNKTEGSLLAVRDDRLDGLDMEGFALELVARARDQGVELAGENGLLTAMVRQVLQTGLNVELAEHLGYQPHAVQGRGTGNSRNGTYPKTVVTDVGPVDIDMPRDRAGTFDPVTVPKHVRRLDGLTRSMRKG
jgi:putative transposase